MNGKAIRVMLVDDHAIVRSGFRRLLEQQPDIAVVAEADSGERAYALYLEHEPDVMVLDLTIPGMSGFEIIRRVIARQPAARILVFSMHEDAALAERTIELGARGYVTKSNVPEILAKAVAEVASGKLFLSPDIAQSIAMYKLTGEDDPLKLLTAREFEIFRLLVNGRSAADIARLLNLSGKTVANYHTGIKQKLGAASDVDLVLLAQKRNLLGVPAG
jgi:two-component system, NarL family, invasion response regulator UvrY